MTDEELIERLQDLGVKSGYLAADRINALNNALEVAVERWEKESRDSLALLELYNQAVKEREVLIEKINALTAEIEQKQNDEIMYKAQRDGVISMLNSVTKDCITERQRVNALRAQAQFLVDRINEYEANASMNKEDARVWCGAVQPAKASLVWLLDKIEADMEREG